MKLDGQLESAQLELLSSAAPSAAPLGRLYADITSSGFKPKVKDQQRWAMFLTDNMNQAAKTANYTLAIHDEVIMGNASGGSFALTLPPAATAVGKVYTLLRTDNTIANDITVTPDSGGETIDGATSFILKTKNDCIRILSTGSVWQLLSHTYDQGWVAWTPTGSWLTNVTYTGKWRRVGDSIDFDVNIAVTGTPTTATLYIAFPSGFQADTTKLTSSADGYAPYVSQVLVSDAGAERYSGIAVYSDTDGFIVLKDDGDGTLSVVNATSPITFANTDAVRVKISGIPMLKLRG